MGILINEALPYFKLEVESDRPDRACSFQRFTLSFSGAAVTIMIQSKYSGSIGEAEMKRRYGKTGEMGVGLDL